MGLFEVCKKVCLRDSMGIPSFLLRLSWGSHLFVWHSKGFPSFLKDLLGVLSLCLRLCPFANALSKESEKETIFPFTKALNYYKKTASKKDRSPFEETNKKHRNSWTNIYHRQQALCALPLPGSSSPPYASEACLVATTASINKNVCSWNKGCSPQKNTNNQLLK